MVKRPILAAAIAFLLGEVLAWFSPLWGTVLLAAIFYSLYNRKKRKKRYGACHIFLIFSLLGMASYSLAVRQDELESYMEKKQLEKCYAEAAGTVSWIQEKNNSYQVCLTEVFVRIGNIPMKTHNILLYFTEEPKVRIGNRIWTKGKLQAFSKASNPGQFDLQSYYRAQNITFGFQVSEVEIRDFSRDVLKDVLWNIRKKLAQNIEGAAEEQDVGIFQAALLGEKSELEEEQKERYQKGGISHILAISGLHISCIGMAFYQLLRRITGSFFIAGVCSGMVMACYAVLTGNPISVIRAFLMFACFLVASDFGRVYDMTSALSLAVLCLLIMSPLQLFQCGFQLSAAAVAGISLLSPALMAFYQGESRFVRAFVISLSIQMATAPILLYHFSTYSTYSILINFLALPFAAYLLFSAGIGAVAGFVSFPLSVFFLGSGHYVLQYYDSLCRLFEALPGSMLIVGKPAGWQLVLYGFFVIAIILYGEEVKERKKRQEDTKSVSRKKNKAQGFLWWKREWEICKDEWKHIDWNRVKKDGIFSVILLIAALTAFFSLWPISYPELEITMLDVGQGDCIALIFPDGTSMLIDGGSSSIGSVGKMRIEPYLKSKGIRQLDYVLMTHPDLDHISGIAELLERKVIPVKKILLPAGEAMETDFKTKFPSHPDITWISAGMNWQSGSVFLQCLHPAECFQSEDTNEYSAVIQLSYGKFTMLFTGDLGSKQEIGLSGLKKIDVLKVAHHGSKHSSSEDFLEIVKPSHSLLSYGKSNTYGHPSEEAVERLRRIESVLWKTPECGAITIQTDGNGYDIFSYKQPLS